MKPSSPRMKGSMPEGHTIHRLARDQRRLFGGLPPVGETIRIAGQPFEIVGVMEEKVQMSNYNSPDKYCVFIPWTTMSGLTVVRTS